MGKGYANQPSRSNQRTVKASDGTEVINVAYKPQGVKATANFPSAAEQAFSMYEDNMSFVSDVVNSGELSASLNRLSGGDEDEAHYALEYVEDAVDELGIIDDYDDISDIPEAVMDQIAGRAIALSVDEPDDWEDGE